MQAKTYLRRLSSLSSKLRLKKCEIDELRELSRSIRTGAEGERVQSSKTNKGFTSLTDSLLDKEREYEEEVKKYLKMRSEAISLILQLDNGLHVDILRLKYFEHCTWEEIESLLNYSCRHLQREHGKALLELNKKLI